MQIQIIKTNSGSHSKFFKLNLSLSQRLLLKICEILRVNTPDFFIATFQRTNYLLKVNNQLFQVSNTSTTWKCQICSKLTRKTPERRHWRLSGVFVVNLKHISHLFVVFVLLTLIMYLFAGNRTMLLTNTCSSRQ